MSPWRDVFIVTSTRALGWPYGGGTVNANVIYIFFVIKGIYITYSGTKNARENRRDNK
jgi:hypothetical protein